MTALGTTDTVVNELNKISTILSFCAHGEKNSPMYDF